MRHCAALCLRFVRNCAEIAADMNTSILPRPLSEAAADPEAQKKKRPLFPSSLPRSKARLGAKGHRAEHSILNEPHSFKANNITRSEFVALWKAHARVSARVRRVGALCDRLNERQTALSREIEQHTETARKKGWL